LRRGVSGRTVVMRGDTGMLVAASVMERDRCFIQVRRVEPFFQQRLLGLGVGGPMLRRDRSYPIRSRSWRSWVIVGMAVTVIARVLRRWVVRIGMCRRRVLMIEMRRQSGGRMSCPVVRPP
jgi:hypothetical protein